MSFKKFLLTASALALLTGNAFADGGPVPEPAAPPPEPPPEPAAPPPEPEPAPPPPAPFNHWYVAGFGGVVWADDFRREIPNFGVIETDLDTGWGAGGAIGYRWESGYRAELEASYRHNSGDITIPAQILDLNTFDVDVDSLSVLLNVLYDFNVGGMVVPYIGVGLGITDADMDIADADASDGWGMAYQFLGGFSVPLPNTSTELFVDYRYHATTGFGLDPFDDDDEYRTQNVMGGVRFYF